MIEFKFRFSLSLKITIIIIAVSLLAITAIAIINMDVKEQEENYLEAQYDKAEAYLHDLNSTIGSWEDINESQLTLNNVKEFNRYHSDLVETNINLYNSKKEDLIVYASSNKNKINNSSSTYIEANEGYLDLSFQKQNTYYIPNSKSDPPLMIVISPIIRSGKVIGVEEIVFSMEEPYQYLNEINENKLKNIILTSVLVIFIIIFVFLYSLRKIIVKPVTVFKDTAKDIGKGDFDKRINIKSRDELGDLADAFNRMVEELKESRDKIEDYNRILKKLLKQKDEFIGQLGHDLKNPLQPLVGLLPMMVEEETDPKKKETLEIMNDNVQYMQDLIFDTLKLAKLRSSNIKFDIETVNLKEISDNVLETQKFNFQQNKIYSENRIDPDIYVKADRLRISEVFKNIINNSIKYSEEGGKVILNAFIRENKVVISITDTGIGMTEEQVKSVFDEFYKADKLSNDYHSTGLGLAICKRIIEKHNGRIWLESPGPGFGSTIYFTLELARF